jgi:RNA polymerase sigma-70 factor (ECF subfamily)
MLGSRTEADDAVQEAWLRLSQSDTTIVRNLEGWLTTVVARICLDALRSRNARREEVGREAEPTAVSQTAGDPEDDVLLADSIGSALLVVLDTLAPIERVAFVLHDLFDLPFGEIARIVGRSEPAARQLTSRARRRLQGRAGDTAGDTRRHMAAVKAFLAASREGRFEDLLALLNPEAILTADEAAVRLAIANRTRGAPLVDREVRGANAVAEAFKGRAAAAEPALLDGEPGAVWAHGGTVRAAIRFVIESDKISAIEVVVEPSSLAEIAVTAHAQG